MSRAITDRQKTVLSRLNVPGERFISSAWLGCWEVDRFNVFVVLKQLEAKGLVERRVEKGQFLRKGNVILCTSLAVVIKGWRLTDAGRAIAASLRAVS